VTGWYHVKLLIEHASGISMDALHILLGVALQMLFARATRVPLTNWHPWLLVLTLLLLNEISDLWVEQWPERAMQYGEGLKDIVLTMLLPTLLLVVARKRPALFIGEQTGDVGTDD
jgi:hypothetical protein